MSDEPHTGGCQCGAIRFRVEGAFGGFYAPLVSVGGAAPTWTRGAPKHFASSNFVVRGFCPACGTPLTYEGPDGVALAIGAFDHPEVIVPGVQFGVEGKLPYVDGLAALPNRHTIEDIAAAPFLSDVVSNQHPDHDTETWPPK